MKGHIYMPFTYVSWHMSSDLKYVSSYVFAVQFKFRCKTDMPPYMSICLHNLLAFFSDMTFSSVPGAQTIFHIYFNVVIQSGTGVSVPLVFSLECFCTLVARVRYQISVDIQCAHKDFFHQKKNPALPHLCMALSFYKG